MMTDAEHPALDWSATAEELVEAAMWAVTRWELHRALSEALDEIQRSPSANGSYRTQ